MERATPYVNYALLSKYLQQTIRIIGKVTQINQKDNTLSLETTDHGSVMVQLNEASIPEPNHYVVITGRINRNMSIDAYSIDNVGTSFDLENMNSLIGMMQKTPALFL